MYKTVSTVEPTRKYEYELGTYKIKFVIRLNKTLSNVPKLLQQSRSYMLITKYLLN